MDKEPRYLLINMETGKEFPLTTDEVQMALFLAKKHLQEQRQPLAPLDSEAIFSSS